MDILGAFDNTSPWKPKGATGYKHNFVAPKIQT